MNKSGIEWCTHTWNPVTGCNHGCEYCYARAVARRFCTNEFGHERGSGLLAPCNGDCRGCSDMDGLEFVRSPVRYAHGEGPFPYGFLPTFYEDRLDEPARAKRKSRDIFVCSVADLFGEWVPLEIILEVLGACEAQPIHNYLFLTKNPKRYMDLWELEVLPLVRGFWYGMTVTNQAAADRVPEFPEGFPLFWSMEPLHGPVDMGKTVSCCGRPSRIIIGAETGNRKGKILPRREWVDEILLFCQKEGIPVFLKNNLRKVLPDLPEMRFTWDDGRLQWTAKKTGGRG